MSMSNSDFFVQTNIQRIDPGAISSGDLRLACELLHGKEVVAFPTETVYGLGANALEAEAAEKIYAAKGRPSNNPLIVHVADTQAAQELVSEWPPAAEKLAAAFWPGPLTLVLPKRDHVPAIVTAGGPTVAIRIPHHPVALALLREVGLPLAAPSANRSNAVSPTTAEHVLQGLEGRIPLILDGGPCAGGLESTVLQLGCSPPKVLRPGLISRQQMEAVLGSPVIGPAAQSNPQETALPSPGMMRRHYAPRAKLELVPESGQRRAFALAAAGTSVAWLAWEDEAIPEPLPQRLILQRMPRQVEAYAAQLYAVLHRLDQSEVNRIVAPLPPSTEAWQAVRDRLQRAASE